MQAMNLWPMSPTGPFYPAQLTNPAINNQFSKPRVGLGVICRCQPQKYGVECLLLKRGPKFVSPFKWSFPGGRLDEDDDLDDDGEKGTMRELGKECGGGTPPGLPPLIHIECYKSGRTLYHVYVLDNEATSWLQWQPSKTLQHTGEIDATATELILQSRHFPAFNGFCWVDLQTLIEECMSINDSDNIATSHLQHGLIRWVKTNAENILKTLLARSPNLACHRRYPPTTTSSPNSTNIRLLAPRNQPILPGGTAWKHTTGGNDQNTRPILQYQPGVPTGFPLVQGPHGPLGVYGAADYTGHDQQHQIGGVVYNHGSQQSGFGSLSVDNTTTTVQAPSSPGRGGLANSAFISFDGSVDGLKSINTAGGMNQMITQPIAIALSSTSSESSTVYNPNVYQTHVQVTESGILSSTSQIDTISGTSENHSHGHTHKQHPRRNELCRHYFINGHCPFGEKCWFVHLDAKSQQREPLLGGDVMTTPMSPVHPQGVWHPSSFLVDQFGNPYTPPQSPLGVPVSPPSWQYVGNRPPFLPLVRPGYQPLGQGPLMFRPLLFPGRFFSPQNHQMLPSISDPILRFRLLSEVTIRDSTSECAVTGSSCLAVRADHFYLSLGQVIRDYRILFGGERHYSDSYCLTVEHKFQAKVTCLHSSKLQSFVVIVGLENGSIFCWDPRKGASNTPILSVHEPTEPEGAITALVHFVTTIAGAQVVAAGNDQGQVTWYIAQPPMKTYTVLSSIKAHTHKIVSLQILGGCLISGSNNGSVCLWNMRSQEPVLEDSFQAYSQSLIDIHVLDTSSFLTVGINQENPALLSLGTSTTTGEVSQAEAPPTVTTTCTTTAAPVSSETVETLSANLDQISLTQSSAPSSANYSASIWDYGKPISSTKTQDNIGLVVSTAFHQQPMFGNRFLALGLCGGTVKIYNLPSFQMASEIHFPDISNSDCLQVALNLSRDKENTHHFNMKNPFRDLILTTVWSCGRVMVCQIEPHRMS